MNELSKISFRISITGIIVNTLLCIVKLIAGYYSGSIAIISDAFDNLSDIGNSILIFIAYRIAAKPADKDHPYGHGRMENMLSQGISLMIMFVGISLLIASVRRIIHPQPVLLDKSILLMIVISIIVKLALAFYYNHVYRLTRLSSLKAQISDSLSDAARNLLVVISYAVMLYSGINLDGWMGIVLSAVIIINGIRLFAETSSVLLGKSADNELTDKITDILSSNPQILGIHDLRIHSYGLNINYASADVEIDGRLSFTEAHDLLDTLEEEIKNETGVIITLHGDPVVNDPDLIQIRKIITGVLGNDQDLTYHDLHYNHELKCYHVDISVPYSYDLDSNDLVTRINDLLHDYKKDIQIQINIDRH